MAPIRRSTSSVPAPKKASTIRETPRQSLFGTSKPSSSSLKKSTTADSKNSKSVKNLKGVQGAKGEGGEGGRSEKEWERDYRDLVRESKRRMGEPSHAMKAIQIVLHVWDSSDEYGPVIGLTRLERWERSEKMGLAPPPEIREILLTEEGSALSEPCFAHV